MSKEIAQTVGGKRIAWLLAILAAFAVMATVGTQFRSASADVTAASYSITGPFTANDCTGAPAANLAAGDTVYYCVNMTADDAPIVAPLEVVVTRVDTDMSLTGVTNPVSGPLPACVSGAPTSVTCTYAGINPTSRFQLAVQATINGDIAAGAAGITATVNDPGVQAAQTVGTNSTVAVNVVASTAASKVNSPTTLTAAGGTYTSTVTYTSPADAGVETTALTIRDNITTAGITIPAGAATFDPASTANIAGLTLTCSSASPAGWPAAAITTTTTTVLSCVVGSIDAADITAGETVGVVFTSSVGASVATRTFTDTGSYTATAGGVSLTATSTVQTVTQTGALIAELRHMTDGTGPTAVFAGREININVRNSRHTICAVQQNTAIDIGGDNDYADGPSGTYGGDIAPVAAQLPGLTLANIVVTNGGGYASTIDTDPTFSDVRIFLGDGTATGLPASTTTAGLLGATCISWVSLDAGDQSISIVYVDGVSGLNVSAHWDSDGDANDNTAGTNGTPNTTIIKEWNRLEDSTVTLTGGATGTVTGTGATGAISRTIGVTLNPATGLYQFTNVTVKDIFRGSHTNSAGQKEGPGVVTGDAGSNQFANGLAGVNWTATLAAGSCGTLGGFPAGSVSLPITGVTTLGQTGLAASFPNLVFAPGGASENCGPGRSATINFTGSEPGPLGSGTGIVVTESVTFTFNTEIAAKQVFLAWAGQRVILEHDWRIAAGDTGLTTDGPNPAGTCPFDDASRTAPGTTFSVKYIKGSGPGNFLPSLGAVISGNDQAVVTVGADDDSQTIQVGPSQDNDIPGDPNGTCISRVLFESEDQGQVDIEAFVDGGNLNVTKHAFVIYYMKINTINVSLATQFSKPSHNSSALADWSNTGGTGAPTNPWDASKDDADNAAEWNVSKDLLVRGRVTGWFVNSNPSGRARDDSNPLNVLPADRWVMPSDWPLLAGGPADPADGSDAIGTAEQFRPYYDIMFAPNNARGIALTNPEGTAAVQVAVVAVSPAFTNTATSFVVSSCVSLPANATVIVGANTSRTVVSCASSVLTVSAVLAGIPAAGTPVFLVTGVPFEGPFSLLDIKGFAGEGKGGAALSNWTGFVGGIRDTTKEDGDVDMWDAPMPPAPVSVSIRGTGFIKQVLKDEVYYLGTPNVLPQTYPNPYYISNIPDSPFIPAIVVGGGYFWDSWGSDGPGGLGQGVYRFWQPAIIGTNSAGVGDALSATDSAELAIIRTAFGDTTIARDLVVYTDNHGEFMVAANGDFKTVLTACQTNTLAGGKHCATGDKVGTGTITATVDYPDFRGKHFPVLSNAATVDWTWGGYKDVTVEAGETDQFKYIVFHAMDRDGFCRPGTTGAVLLHSVLTSEDAKYDFSSLGARYNLDPNENVDFLIDSGEGIIILQSGGGTINDGKQFATGVTTFSKAANDPATSGILEFDLSPLAAEGQTDECQAWIKVSNSLLGVLNVLTIAHDDEGNIGFDRVIDLTNTHSYSLSFRWSLITWIGADAISVNDAIKGTGDAGKNPGGNDISASVTAIYGWDAAAQQWLGFFPSGVNVPGANDLTSLKTGDAYWIAITGPSSVTWTIASNVN